mgnify:CR=1 FL=1
MAKRKRAGWYFILPSLAGVLVFYLIPFGDVVRRSFQRAAGDGFAGLGNYRQVFQNAAFRLAAGNTIRFVSICLPLLLILSLGLAETEKGTESLEECLSCSAGSPGGKSGAVLEYSIRQGGVIEWGTGSFSSDGKGLDEYGRSFLGAGI